MKKSDDAYCLVSRDVQEDISEAVRAYLKSSGEGRHVLYVL